MVSIYDFLENREFEIREKIDEIKKFTIEMTESERVVSNIEYAIMLEATTKNSIRDYKITPKVEGLIKKLRNPQTEYSPQEIKAELENILNQQKDW